MTVERLREIRDARVALEGLLAEKAVLLLQTADLDEITDLCRQMQHAADEVDVSRYLWTNFAFHRRIYAVAQAELTMAAVENFWLHMGPCFALVAPDKATCNARWKRTRASLTPWPSVMAPARVQR